MAGELSVRIQFVSITIGGCLSSTFYTLVAKKILTCHALPDLREAVVLLPNYHVAQPLAQALSREAGLPALLLPQMSTLTDWALSVPLAEPIQSDTQRIATLYQALRERAWFPDADLWCLSRELLALMDELTCHYVMLPDSAAAFAEQLTLAYQARSGQAMQFEARVVHELWYAMTATHEMDASRAYQQRLACLAQTIATPLYILQTGDLSAIEARFLNACRERVTVMQFDLREMVVAEPSCALLTSALQQNGESDDLLSTTLPLDAALHGRTDGAERVLRLFGAQGMEQEAQAADVQVRCWLLEGKQCISVVVQDRLVARRLRALLERAQVQVQDETGWTFATLSVSTVLMRWLEAMQGDFYYQDVLDLLKSPFLFAENQLMRKQAAHQFEQLVRRHGVVAHLQDFIAIAQRDESELVAPLVRLRQAAACVPKRATLSSYLQALHESLDVLGVLHSWRQDAAGQQLLQLLALWQAELDADTTQCSFAEWRRWLSQQLDLNTYRDVSVESPVLFTHLAATRWRSFDAVLILGCDAAHLPAPVNAGQWFNDAVRATLGLPMSTVQQAKVRDDLQALLAMNRNVLVTWQASRNGEPNLLSPHVEMLRALHLMAYGDDLMDHELVKLLDGAQVSAPVCAFNAAVFPAVMPRPVVPENLLPTHISPSAYNSLVACPYQYYARHVLRLNELDEVREALDKRDYGTWVHEILQRFHTEMPLLQDGTVAEQLLRRLSDDVFAQALSHDYLAQAWLLRWQAQIPAYIEWQLENQQAGWRYQAAEVPFKIEISENLILRGRIDRVDVDVNDAQRLAVLDYKTQTALSLKGKLKAPGEEVQLACYARASQARDAAFVSLDDDVVVAVSPPQDVETLATLNIERLNELFVQMRAATPLPAHGVEKICAYCEMRGVCRQGEWARQDPRFSNQQAEVEHG